MGGSVIDHIYVIEVESIAEAVEACKPIAEKAVREKVHVSLDAEVDISVEMIPTEISARPLFLLDVAGVFSNKHHVEYALAGGVQEHIPPFSRKG